MMLTGLFSTGDCVDILIHRGDSLFRDSDSLNVHVLTEVVNWLAKTCAHLQWTEIDLLNSLPSCTIHNLYMPAKV